MRKRADKGRPLTVAPSKKKRQKAIHVPAAKEPVPVTSSSQTTEEMDVHHHPHSPEQKSWKGYVFEFFMLFLAVFCGFLAEWQLEHAIERQRERQFIQSLAEDLKRDTLETSAYIRFTETTLKYCDSLQLCIVRPDLFSHSNAFYDYSRELARYTRYYPTDRTMQQLKNAGNMRLIRKWDVSNRITDYDSKTRLLSELDQQLNEQKTKYRDNLIAFLDLSSYDRLNQPDSYMDNVRTAGNPRFISLDAQKAKVLYNQAFSLRIFSSILVRAAADVKANAQQLLEVIHKEYHIQ